MSQFKRKFSHLSFIFVAVFLSLSTPASANCPFGNCNDLVCLAICEYCGDEQLNAWRRGIVFRAKGSLVN